MTNTKIFKRRVTQAVRSISLSLVCLAVCAATIIAQDKHAQQNLHPGIPYSISDIENINLTNGNLMFNFNFGTVRGRGNAAMPFALKYNSKLYETHVMTTLDISGNNSPQKFLRPTYESGWQYDGDYQLRVINRNDDQEQAAQISDSCGKPNYKAVYSWKLMMYFPDGSQHEFRPSGYSDTSQDTWFGQLQTGDGYFNVDTTGRTLDLAWGVISGSCPNYNTQLVIAQDPNPKMTYYSTDETFMRLEIPNGQDARNPAKWTLFMPDGSKVKNGELDAQSNPLPQRAYDKNGNFVTKGTVTLPDSSTTTGYVDQFGRYVAKKTISPTEDQIIRLGEGGEPIIWKVRWKWITVIKRYTTSTANEGIGRCCYSDQVLVAQHRVIDEIELPSQMGAQKYIFGYNGHNGQIAWNGSIQNPNSSPGWGDLISVTLPSGAGVNYEFATTVPYVAFDVDDLMPLLGKVKEKRLTYDSVYDGSTQQVTDTWAYNINQPSGTSTITGPDGGVTQQFFVRTDTDSDLSGRVYKEINPNGTIIERLWANNKVGGCPAYGCGSMRRLNTYVKTEFMTIADTNGNPTLTAIKDFDYDKNGNFTKITEYDWVSYATLPRDSLGKVSGIPGGATPARITENSYYSQTENASNSTANNPNSYWNSSSPNVRAALGSMVVKDAAGTIKTRSEITYDNPATTANPIETKAWDSTKGAVSNPLTTANSIRTTVVYDSYGNPILSTDAKGNQTQATYGSVNGFTGLYPTQTVSAYGTSMARTSAAQYDFHTGLVTTATDVDNNVSVVSEYDALGRPTKIRTAANTPLESWTRTEYDDVNRRVVVRSDIEAVGDGRKVATQFYDKLGRVRLAKTLEDAATQSATNETDGIKVQTRYKTVSGYTYQLTSNPFRANYASNETDAGMGWTLSTAWSNGRRAEVQTFSGAALSSAFGGSNANSTGIVRTDIDANATTVTDQAGKLRRSVTNALGQLARVDEPNASGQLGSITAPNQPTSYSYNTLGKMVRVQQGIQNRYFMYDSLGRLLRVKQPEQEVNIGLNTTGYPDNNSWSAGFSYDNNGNVLTTTDAKGTTITNNYDALNRPLTRTYSNEPQGVSTPAVTNYYDGLGLQSVPQFSKGKLTRVTSSISDSRYTSFDVAGRLTSSEQRTPLDGETISNAIVRTSSYQYNLSGALTKETYPSGRVVSHAYDASGDIARISGKPTSTATEQTYATGFSYFADGKIEKLKLGNGLWESAKLNSRLQATEIAMGHSVGDGSLMKLNYEYGELNADGVTVDATKNAGNIAKQTVNFSGLAQPFVQTYKYDSLDRIKEAIEKVISVQAWKQTFGYDQYGNRSAFYQKVDSQELAMNNLTLPAVDQNTNRFVSGQGYGYDKNGNVTTDPANSGRQFIFNGDNKQTEVKNSSSVTIGRYYYDGNGKRVRKVTDLETTVFVYDGLGKLVAEYSTATLPANPTINYTATDQLGSPRVLTDKLGNVVSRRDFLPFGEEIYANSTTNRTVANKYSTSDQDAVRQRFTGYQKDTETGLDFAEARMYNNQHGRFTAVDPLLASGRSSNPQTFNRYVYGMNRPLVMVDPTGLQSGKKTEIVRQIIRDEVSKPMDRIQGPGSIILDQRSVEKVVNAALPFVQKQYDMSFAAQNALNAQQNSQPNIAVTNSNTTTTGPTTVTIEGSGTGEVKAQAGVQGAGVTGSVTGKGSITTTIAPGSTTTQSTTATTPMSPQEKDLATNENIGSANEPLATAMENTKGLFGTINGMAPDGTTSTTTGSVYITQMKGGAANILKAADEAGRKAADAANPVDPEKQKRP